MPSKQMGQQVATVEDGGVVFCSEFSGAHAARARRLAARLKVIVTTTVVQSVRESVDMAGNQVVMVK